MRRIAVLVLVVVLLFRRHASDKFQEAIFCIEAEPGDFCCIASFSSMLFQTIFGEVKIQLIKINKITMSAFRLTSHRFSEVGLLFSHPTLQDPLRRLFRLVL